MPRTTTYNSHAGFVADPQSIDRLDGRQIDWANVSEDRRAVPGGVVVVGANAAADATSVTVAALPVAIPAGTVLDFGGKKFARVTAAADVGATALTVAALVTALVATDQAIVAGSGPKVLKAGTALGDTLGAGKISPRVASTNPAMGFLETDAVENDPVHAKSGYGVIVGGVIYEALLPDASGSPRTLASGIKSELNAAGASTGFRFVTYEDNR